MTLGPWISNQYYKPPDISPTVKEEQYIYIEENGAPTTYHGSVSINKRSQSFTEIDLPVTLQIDSPSDYVRLNWTVVPDSGDGNFNFRYLKALPETQYTGNYGVDQVPSPLIGLNFNGSYTSLTMTKHIRHSAIQPGPPTYLEQLYKLDNHSKAQYSPRLPKGLL